MRTVLSGLLFTVLGVTVAGIQPAQAQSTPPAGSCSGISLGALGALNGFVPSPDDAWHKDISSAPVDPNSNKIITTSGDLANRYLHPDFSSVAGGAYGIPYTVVDSTSTPLVPFTNLNYDDESDIAYYPLTSDMPIEGSPGDCNTDDSDRHAIVIDRNSCVIYELYQAASCTSNKTLWSASNGAMWDMLSVEKRPYGYTSVDAAGLSVFEGLVRYDEIQTGAINHAIRFTANHTKDDRNNGYFTAPATHAAGSQWGTDNIIGMRIRLRADFDISGFSPTNQIILTAMKRYGMILADNGSDMFFQGTPDARWNDNDLNKLKSVPSSAFEVVQMDTLYDSETAPTGAAPVISSFTATPSVIVKGQPVVLQSVSNGSYSYIDKAGFTRGAVTVTPTETTTYTLTSRNAYDTATASVTVTVQNIASPTLKFVSIPDQTFSSAPFNVSATSNSAGAITYAVLSGPATIAGSAVTMTGLGTVTLQASQAAAGSFTAGTTTASFVVNGLVPALVFSQIPDQALSTLPLTLSAASNSGGAISYAVVSGPASVAGSLLTLNGAGRVTVMASQAAAGTFASTAVTMSFNVLASSSGLAFVPIPDQTFSATPISVSATSPSTAAITYSVVSGAATVAGNAVTLAGLGTVTLQASQAAEGNFAAGTATTSFAVNGVLPTLVVAPVADQVLGGSPLTLSASSNSSGAISYSVVSGSASVAGSLLTLSGAGSVTVKASQAAAGTFAATSATISFNVAGSAVLLAFITIPDQTFSTTPITVSTFSTSSGAITYSVSSGPATVAGNVVTLTGLGMVSLQANQAAAGIYAAGVATMSFRVNAAVPSLVFSPIADQPLSSTPLTLSASSNSTGAISYSVASGPATVSGNRLTLNGTGKVTVLASQAAAGTFASTSATTSFNVSANTNTLVFAPIADMSFSSTPISVSATSSSTGAITYSVASGPATISGNLVTLTGLGTVTLQASQVAAGNFAAGAASTSFTVSAVLPNLVFPGVPDQILSGTPLTLSASSNSTGPITYSVMNGAAAVVADRLTLNGTGSVTVKASQAAAGTFAAASATISFNVAGSSVLLTLSPIPDQTFSATPITVSASSNSSGAITYSVLSGPASMTGNVLTLTGLGTVALQANQAATSTYAAGVATASFRVNGVVPTLVFPPLPDQGMSSTPLVLSASSNSTGAISYSVASGPANVAGDRLMLTGTGRVTVMASQAAAGTFATASATISFNVSANANNLVFASIADMVFTSTPISVSATSPSTGAITYSVVSGPATLAGNLVTLTGVGVVTLQASQAAAGNFATGTATTSFAVNGVLPTLVVAPVADQVLGGSPLTLSASSNSSGAISYSVVSGSASVAGSLLTLSGAGSVTVKASQAAAGTFAATSATISFNVAGSAVLLAFITIPDQTFSTTPITVSTFSTSSGAITYSVSSGPATVAGNVVTLTGLGMVSLQANQAAAGIYAAGVATMSFRVNAAVPSLVFSPIADQPLSSTPLTLSASSNSTGAISYSVASGPATVSGNRLTLNGTGKVTVLASQAAAGTFASTSATTSFNVSANTNTLVFAPIADMSFSSTPISVSATSSSTGAITYSVASGPATISGNLVTLTGLGTVTLQASQVAAGNFAAGAASTSFTVSAVLPNLVFPGVPDQILSGTPLTLSASSNSTGPITYSVMNGAAAVVADRLTLNGTGSVTVKASQAAAGTFAAASATISFNVSANANNLVFAPIADQVFSSTPLGISATSSSGGAITYSVVNGPAVLAGNLVTLTGVGTVTLQASQAAAGNYSAGMTTASFTVTGALPTLVFPAIPDQVMGGQPLTLSVLSNSSGAISYSVVNGSASVAGNHLTLNGTGSVTVRASQAASGTFAATSSTVSFNVSGSAVLLAFMTIPDQPFSAAPIIVSTFSTSNGAITYSVLSGPATITGNVLTLTGLGTVALQANQAPAGIYAAGVATMNFRVLPVTPKLAVASVPAQLVNPAPVLLSASSGSPAPKVWAVLGGPAKISGNALTLVGAGIVTVQVSQAAQGTYAAATATTSFAVMDFVLNPVPQLKIPIGKKASTPVSLIGLNGFAGAVGMACALPGEMGPASCSVGDVMLKADGSQAASTLTIATVLPVSADARHRDMKPVVEGGSALAVLLLPFGLRRKRRSLPLLPLLLVSVASTAVTGCGVGEPTQAGKGTFDVQLTATSVPASHTTTVEVVVY